MKKQRPNIIFIVIDALRDKNLGCYGYHRNTSPNIDKLAKGGVLFENCYSCSTSTDPSFTSIFSGKYPTSHGIIHHGPKVTSEEEESFYRSDTKMLAEILKSNGYTTIGIDWLGRWHKMGFDYYWGSEEGGAKESIFNKILKRLPVSLHDFLYKIIDKAGIFIPDNDAGIFTKIALDRMGNSKTPFFLMIHYLDTHSPFKSPRKHQKFDTSTKKTKIRYLLDKIGNEKWREQLHKIIKNPELVYVEELESKYDASINYVDFQIGRIIEFLRKTDEDTIIIITGDHGTLLGEHFPFFSQHGLFEEIIHVPLIIKYANHLSNKKISPLVQHVDIVPTILELVGVDLEKHKFDGDSLLPAIKRGSKIKRKYAYITDSIVERFAILDGRFKYIYSKDNQSAICPYCGLIHEGAREVLYDLKKDPDETQNALAKNTSVAVRLKKDLLKKLVKENRGGVDMTEELLKRIKFHLKQQKKGWKHFIYGMGELYQSFDELKIKGKRNTKDRIKKYELKKHIKKYYNILDIGCNCGFIDLKLSPHVNSIDSIEINPFLIDIANEVKSYLKIKNVEFYPIGFEEYETDKKYEAVFSFAVDNVVDGLSKLSFIDYIKKISSLMVKDGYLFFESQASDIFNGIWDSKYAILQKNFKIIKEKRVFSDYPLNARERVFLILQKNG